MALGADAFAALTVWATLACVPLHAQPVQVAPGAAGRIIGEVVALDAATQNISLKTDKGEAVTVALTERATLRKVPPGAPDLEKTSAIVFADLSVEDALHPCQPSVPQVQRGQAKHHKKRRQNEREGDEGCPEHSKSSPSQVDRQLSRKAAGRQLRQRQAFPVFLKADPALPVYQIPLHCPSQSDRTTETECAEFYEVREQLPKTASAKPRGGVHIAFIRDREYKDCLKTRYSGDLKSVVPI